MSKSKLYVIATPIGHKLDITLRCIETLKSLTCFFCEDTRELKHLMQLHSIPMDGKKFFSYSSHNMKQATEQALNFLQQGESIGLTSDRGTPAISDPGALLVQAARNSGIDVVPIPGVSSVTSAFSVAGLTEPHFLFTGFFPQTLKEKNGWLERVKNCGVPVCFLESPNRIANTLEFLKEEAPQGKLFIAREMTKTFEEYRWVEWESSDPLSSSISTLGEFTLIFIPPPQTETFSLDEQIQERMLSDKEWCKAIAQKLGVKASDIYAQLEAQKKIVKKKT